MPPGPDKFWIVLGDEIAISRLRANMTQKEVAAYFGIDRVNVSYWESGTVRPDIYRIRIMGELFNSDWGMWVERAWLAVTPAIDGG